MTKPTEHAGRRDAPSGVAPTGMIGRANTHHAHEEVATTSTAKTGNTTLVDGLVREFAGRIPPDVVERAAAAARHVLERSRIPATRDAVERLTRDQLRARLSPRVGR